jgi:hypothetical protein
MFPEASEWFDSFVSAARTMKRPEGRAPGQCHDALFGCGGPGFGAAGFSLHTRRGPAYLAAFMRNENGSCPLARRFTPSAVAGLCARSGHNCRDKRAVTGEVRGILLEHLHSIERSN